MAAVIGAAKDLAECVCNVVIDALGGTYGSNVKMPKLVSETLHVLDLHPAGLQNHPALQRLSQSVGGMVQAAAELRSTDGTGHGRSQETNLDPDHAALVGLSTLAWCRWGARSGQTCRAGKGRAVGTCGDDQESGVPQGRAAAAHGGPVGHRARGRPSALQLVLLRRRTRARRLRDRRVVRSGEIHRCRGRKWARPTTSRRRCASTTPG